MSYPLEPLERQYGAARDYRVHTRNNNPGTGDGIFDFSEKFYESDNKNYDAILILGIRMNHHPANQDSINSWLWRGFSGQARAISRLFIKEITCTYSIPSFLDIITYDYTGRLATIGTVDNGIGDMPDLASDGVLAELRTINAYISDDAGTWIFKNWEHMRLSPLKWIYEDLEITLPLSFYHYSIGFGVVDKPCWVFWKLTAGVRFHTSEKANPKFKKGIVFGGKPT